MSDPTFAKSKIGIALIASGIRKKSPYSKEVQGSMQAIRGSQRYNARFSRFSDTPRMIAIIPQKHHKLVRLTLSIENHKPADRNSTTPHMIKPLPIMFFRFRT